MYLGSHKLFLLLFLSLFIISYFKCDAQDPWDYDKEEPSRKLDQDKDIPPDLRIIKKTKIIAQTDDNYATGEWFYRRLLSIVLKGGEVKENEDGYVDISLQMKVDQKEYSTIQEYLTSTTVFTEDKFRRSLGYIEQSIYEPSLPTKIILAWSDHIQMFLTDYKTEITWSLGLLALSSFLYWLWRHMSHKNAIIIAFIALYAYEVFISYKEAEQKEIDMFVAAVNSCKWYIWSSQCELPKPDPLIFLKHMNPLKIGIRMFTSIISEPIIVLSDTVKTLTHGITDGLWYPFDTIMYGILITFFNLVLLIFLITIICNYVLNMPIDLSFGLFSVGLRQRKRNIFGDISQSNQTYNSTPRLDNTNVLSGATLDKLLDVVARTLNTPNNSNVTQNAIQGSSDTNRRQITNSTKNTGLRRSASTGRLPNLKSFESNGQSISKRNLGFRIDGAGDAS